MLRTIVACFALTCGFLLAGCQHKVQNPIAGIDSKQPDKTLYDRAVASMKKGRFQEARTLLETLINAYPDSEYIARAKLAVGDSWYNEGGAAAWKQAELEYKDFQVFYPNIPESAEAQLKVATIHYRQMEKPDRDFAECARAAEEYKILIQQYPDTALAAEAKQRLREVQEVLAERQFRIANFYYLRDNLAASQARLQSLIDSYPLYSGVDQALFELGSLYEKEAANLKRQPNIPDALKEKLVANFQKSAIDAYDRIITRYPAMSRAGDARKRLEALNAPIPTPTAEAMAESKAEQQSRGSVSMTAKLVGNFKKHPNVALAPGTGDPTLTDETVNNPALIVQDLTNRIGGGAAGNQKLSLEPVSGGSDAAPGPNQPPPGTASAPTQPSAESASVLAQPPAESASVPAQPPTGSATAAARPPAGKNATLSIEGAPPSPAPAQINEVQKDSGTDAQASGNVQVSQNTQPSSNDNKQDSSSKKKGKKGLRKLIHF